MKRDLGEGLVVVNGEPCHELEPFDPTNDDQLAQIVPAQLVDPLHALFSSLIHIRMVRHSFGENCVNVRAAVEELERDAEEIYKACAALWRNA